MMNETQIKSVSMFFFYAFLEESVATPAINRALLGIQKSMAKNDFDNTNAAIVYWTNRYWQKYKKKAKFINIGLERMYKIQKDVDLEPWKQLQKELTQNEYLVAIWSGLLGFAFEEIASGLAVSHVTIQHRTGIAFKKLGSLLNPGKSNAKKRA